MNLADALRKAKHNSGDSVLPTVLPAEPEITEAVCDQQQTQEVTPPVSQPFTFKAEDSTPQPSGSIVRLELFLTPEQLSGLFRAVVAAQHSVMTLREAANHVRVPGHVLEELAREGEIPAFLVDGKWRFPRNGVDEWMNMQSSKKEAS